jgi:endonuclease-8
MPIGELGRVAAVMRTALVGHPMVRFDAPGLVGPEPELGRLVEAVEAHGKHVEVTWDDGIVLDTLLRSKSEWHVYRHGDPWRRSWDHLRASIQTEDFVAVCFAAASVETYRQPDRSRHPIGGRLGPDLASPNADLAAAVAGLLTYRDPEARVRDAIVDQHVMRGLGNVFRCEVLWGAELSPWAHVADLTHDDAVELVTVAERLVRASRSSVRPTADRARTPESGLAVYGRCGQACFRCHDTVESLPVGRHGRMLYWCPGCQTRLDRRLPDPRPMDPHPAASKFLSELPWRRTV